MRLGGLDRGRAGEPLDDACQRGERAAERRTLRGKERCSRGLLHVAHQRVHVSLHADGSERARDEPSKRGARGGEGARPVGSARYAVQRRPGDQLLGEPLFRRRDRAEPRDRQVGSSSSKRELGAKERPVGACLRDHVADPRRPVDHPQPVIPAEDDERVGVLERRAHDHPAVGEPCRRWAADRGGDVRALQRPAPPARAARELADDGREGRVGRRRPEDRIQAGVAQPGLPAACAVDASMPLPADRVRAAAQRRQQRRERLLEDPPEGLALKQQTDAHRP